MPQNTEGRGLNAKLVRSMATTMSLACLAIVLIVAMQSMLNANEQLRHAQDLLVDGLDQKGMLLTENHEIALRSMVEGNAFGDVDSLVRKTVSDDSEVVYGLFLDRQGRPWSFHGPGIEDKNEWKRLHIDPEQSEAKQREFKPFGSTIREYSVPVVLDDEVVGTIRYGLSTASLERQLGEARTAAIGSVIFTVVLIVMIGVGAAVMGILFTSQRSRSITEPLAALADAARRIAEGEKGVQADVRSGDELELLADAFNEMVSDLESSYEKLQAFSQGLELAVAERTAELRVKTEDVRRMLDNIEQGVFTVLDDLTLHGEYSANLEVILERKDLGGQSFDELFLKDANLGTAALATARFVLNESFGTMGFLFMCNRHQLPRELNLETPEGTQKLLELEYVGIEDEEENLERVLVIVRDVTELRALRAQADAQREALQLVGELIAVPHGEVQRFFERSFRFLDENRALIIAHPESNESVLDELFRNMHTLKGNARLLGFERLNDVVHDAEDLYRQLRRNEIDWDPDALIDNGEGVRSALQQYLDVFESKLSGRGNDEPTGLPIEPFVKLLEGVKSGRSSIDDVVAELSDRIFEATTTTLPDALAGAIRQLPGLADQLDKETPTVTFIGDEVRLHPEVVDVIQDVFLHVLRNSIDHGIETAEERAAAGKSPAGTVTIDVDDQDGKIELRVRDDGKGLPIRILREKLGNPNASLEEVAEVPFRSGVSTAQAVTSVSGRGVGMDAVRQFLVERGGAVWMEIDPPQPGAERSPFTLVLVCPNGEAPEPQTV